MEKVKENIQGAEVRNGSLAEGIVCPICGGHLKDAKHGGVGQCDDKNLHQYYCKNCNIDIEVYVNEKEPFGSLGK